MQIKHPVRLFFIIFALFWALPVYLMIDQYILPKKTQSVEYLDLTGRVVDQANLLSVDGKNELVAKLKDHEKATGNQVVVATVTTLGNESIEQYANELFRRWELGQRDKNNGVLILIAPKEHKMRIEVGYGLEGTLTDAYSKLIINFIMVPEFKSGLVEQGIIDGATATISILNGETDTINSLMQQEDEVKSQFEKRSDGSQVGAKNIAADLAQFAATFIGGILFLTAIGWLARKYLPNSGSGSNSSSGSDSSSSSSSFSSSDSFSGGGGSSGGGGASGSW